MIKVGYGNRNGKPWDDGGKSEISRIFISYGDKAITNVQFQYAKNGDFVLSEKHGLDAAENFDVVKLNHPSERIISVSGTMNLFGDHVTSIKFTTNKKTYGPFGCPLTNRKPFEYKMGNGFGGFFGSASNCLNSIGVYVNPNTA